MKKIDRKYTKLICCLTLVMLITVLLPSPSVQALSQLDLWSELESQETTTNFIINYTTSDTWPLDMITPEQAQEFGLAIEEIRATELSYGFREDTLPPNYVLLHHIGYGIGGISHPAWRRDYNDYCHKAIQIDSPTLRNSIDNSWTDVYEIFAHEYLHSIQYGYEQGFPVSCEDYPVLYVMDDYAFLWPQLHSYAHWMIEGQAELMIDKYDPDVDTDFLTMYTSSIWDYLMNPEYHSRSLLEISYEASLFWTYVAEQYGSQYTEEPELGIDTIVEYWRGVDEDLALPFDEIEAFDNMLDRLNYPDVTFEDVFKDFVVANFAKDLEAPARYQYTDDDSEFVMLYDPYPQLEPYGKLIFEEGQDVEPRRYEIFSGQDFVDPWMPNYYRYRRGEQLSDYVTVEVNQLTQDRLFFAVLVNRSGVLVEDLCVYQTGTEYLEVITGLQPEDEIILIVAGLDNSHDSPAKYHYAIAPGRDPTSFVDLDVEILYPETSRPAYVGPIDSPEKILLIVRVHDLAQPIEGLGAEDFLVRVDTRSSVWEEVDVITASYREDLYLGGLYFLEIVPPTVPYFSSLWDGDSAHLSVAVNTFTEGLEDDQEFNSLIYSDEGESPPPVNTVIVIDRSGSMSHSLKLEAAQEAASLYVNSFLGGDRVALVQFNHDALLLHALGEVLVIESSIQDQIWGMTATGSTSIGDGLFYAQNELYLNAIPSARRNHTILLTDGRENTDRWLWEVESLLYDNNTLLDVVLIGLDAQAMDLQNIARNTLGEVFFAFDPASGTLASSLASIYRSVAERNRGEQRIFSTSGQLSGSWSVLEEFEMDTTRNATLVFNYKSEQSQSGIDIFIQLPEGGTITPTLSRERQGPSTNYYGHFVWDLPDPTIGTYILNASGLGEIEYFFDVGAVSSTTLNTYSGIREETYFYGDRVPIVVTLSDTSPIINAHVVANVTAGTAYNNTQSWLVHLFDDGAHGDGRANDGVYGNYFTRTAELGVVHGLPSMVYTTSIKANGTSNSGHGFTREMSSTFTVSRAPLGDRDNDGLPDVWERFYHLSTSVSTSDDGPMGDPDMDGLINLEELRYGTNPTMFDTDWGGENDYSEILNGQDPLYEFDDTIVPPLIRVVPGLELVKIYFGSRMSYSSLQLFRSLTPDGVYTLVASDIDSSIGVYTDTDLTNDETYYYRMMANTSDGHISGFSHPVATTPKEDPYPPWGGVTIDDGAKYTNSEIVTLTIEFSPDAIQMRISNDADFDGAIWIDTEPSLEWMLDGEGYRSVFVQFKDVSGNIGGRLTCSNSTERFALDSIIYDSTYTAPDQPPDLIGLVVIIGTGLVSIVVLVLLFIRKKQR